MARTVKEIIGEVSGRSSFLITEDADLAFDLSMDSLDLVKLMLTIEDEYKLSDTPKDVLARLTTVLEVEEYVRSMVSCRKDSSSH